jgi:hypothetical protein
MNGKEYHALRIGPIVALGEQRNAEGSSAMPNRSRDISFWPAGLF